MSGSAVPLTKECRLCGSTFPKRYRDSADQWRKRQFCSPTCSNRAKAMTDSRERFWKNIRVDKVNGCWVWQGSTDGRGYGKMSTGSRTEKQIRAHRYAYELFRGPIPSGMFVCHQCDTPACCNPAHLYAGTQTDNMRDASRRNRLNPKSMLNLRPGANGYHGAGPYSVKEITDGKRQ